MPVLESDIERKVCARAKKLGLLSIKFSSPASRGWPDRIFIGAGAVIAFVEFKKPGEKPTKLQELRINKLRSMGLDVHIVASCDEGYKLVSQLHTASLSASRNTSPD